MVTSEKFLTAVCFLMLRRFSVASGNIPFVIKVEQSSAILGLVGIDQLGAFEAIYTSKKI